MNSTINKIAFIDIGNSRLKFVFETTLNSFIYDDSWLTRFKYFLQNIVSLPEMVLISSVNSKIKAELLTVLNDFELIVVDSQMLLERQQLIDFSQITGMGNDRKLGLLGALNYHKPPLITIDCGTAVTINVINKNYICLGGVIFADIYTQAKGLSHNTAALPEVDLYFENKFFGTNTKEALRIGIVKSVVFGIKGITEQIIKNEFDDQAIPIFLTGGSAKIIAEGLKDWIYNFHIKDNLVLDGLYYLIKDNEI